MHVSLKHKPTDTLAKISEELLPVDVIARGADFLDFNMDGQSEIQRYRVNSSTGSSQKSIYQIKLTDASLKALEEFQRNKDKGSFKIKLTGNNGEVLVPTHAGAQNFKFSVSNITLDQLSSFECLSEKYGQMSIAGPMSKKLTVLATDDVYKTTREKMTLAEEESKKNCTKVIKQNEAGRAGRVIRKPVRPTSLSTASVSKPSLPAPKPQPSSAIQPGVKRQPLGMALPLGSQESFKTVSSPNEIKPLLECKPLLESRPSLDSRPSLGSKPLLESKPSLTSSSHTSVKPLGNSSIVNYPYRDRIIHLLAVRPYRKIELQQTLERDGTSEREKQSWTSVLGQVAIFNPRDNYYSLSQSYYSEIKEDWPFYSEETRKEVKKKLSQFNESLNSTSVSPVLSPCSSTGSSQGASPIDAKAKKHSSSSDYGNMPAKKQRIAHTKKDATQTSQTVSSNTGLSATPQIPAPEKIKTDRKERSSLEFEGQENMNVSKSKDTPTYLRTYIPVTNVEQRYKYKGDFNQEYGEYCALYNQINERTQIFKKLHQEFEKSQGTDRESARNQIFAEYEKLQRDETYASKKARYDYLEKKLRHIKEQVQDFDRQQLASSSS